MIGFILIVLFGFIVFFIYEIIQLHERIDALEQHDHPHTQTNFNGE